MTKKGHAEKFSVAFLFYHEIPNSKTKDNQISKTKPDFI